METAGLTTMDVVKRIPPHRVMTVILAVTGLVWIDVSFRQALPGWEPVGRLVGTLAILFGLLFVAARVIDQIERRKALALLWTGAIAFRLLLIPAGLDGPRLEGLREDLTGDRVSFERYVLYDDDLWRFLWEGQLVANGRSPYLLSPDAAAASSGGLAPLESRADWEEIADRINHPAHASVYPPAAQLFFALSYAIAPGSVVVWKLLITAADLATIAVLLLIGRIAALPLSAIVLFAWNPLLIKVGAGSGHFDILFALALTATTYFVLRGRKTAAAVTFAAAVLTKISPLILLPLLARFVGWRATLVAIAAIATPLVLLSSSLPAFLVNLGAFGSEWSFNNGFFRAAAAMTGSETVVRLIGIAVVAGILLRVVVKSSTKDDFPNHATTVMGGALLASPVVMPWYVVWVLPLAAIARQSFWTIFSLLVCAALFIMVDGTEYPLVLAIEYGIVAALLITRYPTSSSRMVPATVSPKEIS